MPNENKNTIENWEQEYLANFGLCLRTNCKAGCKKELDFIRSLIDRKVNEAYQEGKDHGREEAERKYYYSSNQ